MPAEAHPNRMYTRCPKCETLYPLEAKDLRAGHGEVLCGRCHIIFSALGALADNPEQAYADPYAALSVPTLGRADQSPAVDDEPIISLRAEPRRPPPADALRNEEDYADHFAEFETSQPKGSSPLWGIAALAALVGLGYQVLLFESENLARQPSLRPWLERLCPKLNCRVPEFRDLARLEVVERNLTPAHDGVDGLEFRAVLANYADQAQPYPRLKLTLSQYNGDPMAQRIFTPEEYLPETLDRKAMAAGGAAEIHLTIANPGKDVGGFMLELL